MKIQTIRNYAEGVRRGAILVQTPLAALETISVSEPASRAPGKSARHFGVISTRAARRKS